ncbi:alpha/beta fold hydrolase [Aspergillus brunneoviolaceus CBS 621.78]|uniref:Alpha/beta-hydrolase n=1 Tax=Aspergillus brunneoviolaceus CBS 621.78 TaxID=1450534 RepID=A0ACD1GKY0_9EURO|nr:alpha/beta-hydrolase [Aspergillus brunneoviolaceus CBS 621.78]RAH49931.1 alpha/beta-hydrolase [Aspergillus brunneoviolaceus CBS 621.78]
MAVDKIDVTGDPRVERRSANLNGNTYSYLYSEPESGVYRATIFLLHGFPDLSMGWRYQIPMLLNLGLRVVAPDCLGYGQTDAPENIHLYSHRNCANDIKELASLLDAHQIILGGHDWGAALAYRVALWHPTLVSHVFTVCVPYAPPTRKYLSLEALTERRIAPHFGYQLQFRGRALERNLQGTAAIARFLSALYGGRTADEEKSVAFDAEVGVLWDRLEKVAGSGLLSEVELEYYAAEFARNGLRGPLNWYRTRKINYEDELAILNRRITAPLLFIQALKDPALPPNLGGGMTRTIPHLTYKQVNTGHWALWQKPEEVNKIIAWWLEEVVFGRAGLSRL